MEVQSLIDIIRQKLAQVDNSNTNWTDAQLIAYINEASKAVARRIPWRTHRLIVGTSVSKYPLPANCMTVDMVDTQDGGTLYLPGYMHDMTFTSETVATPRSAGNIYAVENRHIYFAPVLAQTVRLYYWGYPAAVTDAQHTVEAPETLRECYITRVMADALDDIDSPKADKYEQKYAAAILEAEGLEAATRTPLATQVRYATPN